ncbi:MAG: ElyC/SanA/YdcF family protein [Candidatus Gracilibacteria bacterium]|jgi:SanA protein
MKIKNWIKKIDRCVLHKFCFFVLFAMVLIFAVGIDINFSMFQQTGAYIYSDLGKVPAKPVVMVLGAKVYVGDKMSSILLDRVQTALEIYQAGKAQKILLSGDHGTKTYDEVNTMKKYLLDHGVLAQDIFLDHAGFDTYDSFYRARDVFEVKSMIVVTQAFHLPRAVYIGNAMGIDTVGFVADKQRYQSEFMNNFRESFARVKAFFDVKFYALPKFLGPKIPITGDSHLSWD